MTANQGAANCISDNTVRRRRWAGGRIAASPDWRDARRIVRRASRAVPGNGRRSRGELWAQNAVGDDGGAEEDSAGTAEVICGLRLRLEVPRDWIGQNSSLDRMSSVSGSRRISGIADRMFRKAAEVRPTGPLLARKFLTLRPFRRQMSRCVRRVLPPRRSVTLHTDRR